MDGALLAWHRTAPPPLRSLARLNCRFVMIIGPTFLDYETTYCLPLAPFDGLERHLFQFRSWEIESTA